MEGGKGVCAGGGVVPRPPRAGPGCSHGCPCGRWAQTSLSLVLSRHKVKCHRGATGRGQGGGSGPPLPPLAGGAPGGARPVELGRGQGSRLGLNLLEGVGSAADHLTLVSNPAPVTAEPPCPRLVSLKPPFPASFLPQSHSDSLSRSFSPSLRSLPFWNPCPPIKDLGRSRPGN